MPPNCHRGRLRHHVAWLLTPEQIPSPVPKDFIAAAGSAASVIKILFPFPVAAVRLNPPVTLTLLSASCRHSSCGTSEKILIFARRAARIQDFNLPFHSYQSPLFAPPWRDGDRLRLSPVAVRNAEAPSLPDYSHKLSVSGAF